MQQIYLTNDRTLLSLSDCYIAQSVKSRFNKNRKICQVRQHFAVYSRQVIFRTYFHWIIGAIYRDKSLKKRMKSIRAIDQNIFSLLLSHYCCKNQHNWGIIRRQKKTIMNHENYPLSPFVLIAHNDATIKQFHVASFLFTFHFEFFDST